MSRVAALVLAAGASTRMGRPKALVPWRGRAFVTHGVDLARHAACEPIVVVDGAVRLPDDVLDGATRVHNDAWRRGQLSSLQSGLRAVLGDDVTGVLVLTVDRPHVSAATVAALVDAHRERPDAVWQPSYRGRRGHPILVPRDVAHIVLGLDASDASSSLREVLARVDVARRKMVVEVEDAAVLDNLDRPEDLRRLP